MRAAVFVSALVVVSAVLGLALAIHVEAQDFITWNSTGVSVQVPVYEKAGVVYEGYALNAYYTTESAPFEIEIVASPIYSDLSKTVVATVYAPNGTMVWNGTVSGSVRVQVPENTTVIEFYVSGELVGAYAIRAPVPYVTIPSGLKNYIALLGFALTMGIVLRGRPNEAAVGLAALAIIMTGIGALFGLPAQIVAFAGTLAAVFAVLIFLASRG